MAGLQLKQVSKRFAGNTVIRELSLSIEPGEFVVLVGPSGCGKSTLLRMIAGLEPISSGDLWIGEQRANDITPQKRNIAMVFQSYALFPHLTVEGNISFGPQVRGESASIAAGLVQKAGTVLNLLPYLQRRPAQLSGGQRQRVAMGRAIVRDPQVFLFDEPLSNLDAQLRVQMRTEIKALHQKLKSTTVYVTHDQLEAMTMADRIVVMNQGKIEQTGAPLELYDRPANLFVASFIGSPAMAFLPCRYESEDNTAFVTLADQSRLPVPSLPLKTGTSLTLGLRPEALSREEDGPLSLSIEVVEPTGPEIQVVGQLAGTEVRAILRERRIPQVGEVLRFSVAPHDLHLFDPESTQRIALPLP